MRSARTREMHRRGREEGSAARRATPLRRNFRGDGETTSFPRGRRRCETHAARRGSEIRRGARLARRRGPSPQRRASPLAPSDGGDEGSSRANARRPDQNCSAKAKTTTTALVTANVKVTVARPQVILGSRRRLRFLTMRGRLVPSTRRGCIGTRSRGRGASRTRRVCRRLGGGSLWPRGRRRGSWPWSRQRRHQG